MKDILIDQRSFLSNRKTIERSFPESYLKNEEVVIISGVRRCGKSVLLQQIRKRMPEGDYFFNFDDDRLSSFSENNFQELYEVFVEMYGEQHCFYFDEIQNISGWEHFVKRLYNMGNKVFLTGSNARMLSKELGTLLTGCYVKVDLYPFSFSEYLEFKGKQELIEAAGTIQRGLLQKEFMTYMKEGGFPMFLKSGEADILKTLYDNILYRDVLVRNQITNEKELKKLVYYMVSNIGKPFTYTSLTKIIGVKNPTSIKNYLDFLENTYLLFCLSKMDFSVKAQIRNPKKLYIIDNAMMLRLGFHFSEEEGRLLENLVFIELLRRGGEIFYYNNGTAECDFVVRDGFEIQSAIQVCTSMENPQIREREVSGLLAAMQSHQLQDGIIVTLSQKEELEMSSMKIHIVPATEWLLRKG